MNMKKDGELKGFAGISKLSAGLNPDPPQKSIIDDDTKSTSQDINDETNTESLQGSLESTAESEEVFEAETKPDESKKHITSDSDSKSNLSPGFWIVTCIIIVFISMVLLEENNSPRVKKVPTQNRSNTATRNKSSSSNNDQNSSRKLSANQGGQSPSSNRDIQGEALYSKPIIGENLTLTEYEISWCLREEIRLETMKNHLETEEALNFYNQKVEDYNKRCAYNQYLEKDYGVAKRKVNGLRESIVASSIQEIQKINEYKRAQEYAELISSIQTYLSSFGFNPGIIDGNYGDNSKEAVKSFQKQVGLPANAVIDENLVEAILSYAENPTNYRPSNSISFPIDITLQRDGKIRAEPTLFSPIRERVNLGSVIRVVGYEGKSYWRVESDFSIGFMHDRFFERGMQYNRLMSLKREL